MGEVVVEASKTVLLVLMLPASCSRAAVASAVVGLPREREVSTIHLLMTARPPG